MPTYHIYEHEGKQYHCGCKRQQCPGRLRAYQVARPVYTLEQITAAIVNAQGSLFAWVWVILDQGPYGDCWDYSALNTLMTKIHMLYGEKVLLDASIAIVLTGQYDGGAIDSAISQVQSVVGVPTAVFMDTDPTQAITKRSKSLWPTGWQQNAAERIVPAGEWTQTASPLELASGLIDGNPGVVGVSWQGGGHALEAAEVKTAAQLHADIEAAGSDGARRQRDSLLLPVACRDPVSGKQTLFDPAVIDYASDTELLFAGPNSWGVDWNSGWGSYPGRAGWWLLSSRSRAMQPTFSSEGFGSYVLCGVKDSALDPAPDA